MSTKSRSTTAIPDSNSSSRALYAVWLEGDGFYAEADIEASSAAEALDLARKLEPSDCHTVMQFLVDFSDVNLIKIETEDGKHAAIWTSDEACE